MTDQQKRTAINTATINFAKSVRDNAINKVIDVIQAAGSSAATEPEETYTATGLSISLSPLPVTVRQGSTATATVSVTSTNNGTYTLMLSGVSWATLNNHIITIAPPSSTTAGEYNATVTATGAETATATLTVVVTAATAITT